MITQELSNVWDATGDIISVPGDVGPGTDTPMPQVILTDQSPMTAKVWFKSITAQNVFSPNGDEQLSFALYRNGVQIWPRTLYIQCVELAQYKSGYPLDLIVNGGSFTVVAKNISGSLLPNAAGIAGAFSCRASWRAILLNA